MKKHILVITILAIAAMSAGQEATVLSMQGIGGNAVEQTGSTVLQTTDGGFIISVVTKSTSGTGNIDTFASCTSEANYSTAFLKYRSDGSVREWTKCYDQSGDSAFGYIFPITDGFCTGRYI